MAIVCACCREQTLRVFEKAEGCSDRQIQPRTTTEQRVQGLQLAVQRGRVGGGVGIGTVVA